MNINVSTLVRYLKYKLDTDDKLQKINVVGEISNYHCHFSGHLYFTLKDASSAIDCVMFKSSANSLKFTPKNGDQVVVNATASIFESSGKLQLLVSKMTIDGIGDLYAKYLELKEKLEKEGYFDSSHKIPIPSKYLERVAVLVGEKSAAMSDIKRCFARRWPFCKVDYYPVTVQGNSAPMSIIEKLKEVDKLGYDAIILSRGGGSFEDLFCFNDENLVKTIYDLKTFIVTGVGHEQDFTLVDFVADVRAATPTAAVEVITPSIDKVLDSIDELEKKMQSSVHAKLNEICMKYDLLCEKLANHKTRLVSINNTIQNSVKRMQLIIKNNINNYKYNIDVCKSKMKDLVINKLNTNKLLLKRYETLLEAYSNESVLNRGYTLVFQKDKLIKRKASLDNKEELKIRFTDGTILAKIKE